MVNSSQEERHHLLNEMKNFLEEEESWFQNLLKDIGWDINDIPKLTKPNTRKFQLCPINNEHRVPEDSFDVHVSKCCKKYEEYPDFSEDFTCIAEGTSDGIPDTKKTTDLALSLPSANDSSLAAHSSSSQYLIELLTAERDAKRRRAAYRKKRVHTNKKSYNEILRELIDNEMKTLEDDVNTEETSGSNTKSTNADGGRSEKNTTYAGVGNWIYHGNPYKRWMKINEEEQEFFKNVGNDKEIEYPKDPASSSHNSHQDRHSSYRHFSHSSSRDKRSYNRDEHRHYEKRERYSTSTRSPSFGDDSLRKERIPGKFHSVRIKEHESPSYYSNWPEKSNDRHAKSEVHSSDLRKDHGSKTYEDRSSYSLDKIHHYDNMAVDKGQSKSREKNSKDKHEQKYSTKRRRSDSVSDAEKKRQKKNKHKKHSKKKKNRRSSSESSS